MVRKIISPVLRFVVSFVTPNSKLTIVRRTKLPRKPVIFAATHNFREDAEHTVVIAGRQTYMLNGSISQVFKSFDGITAWIAGMVLVDRTDKESPASAVSKLVRALELGSSVVIFPEGTWNKSPNELISGLFSGVYDVAKKSGALVVPIATYRSGKRSYGISEEAFDICQYAKEEGMQILRDSVSI
ncbi:MAG: lysophospholipid acyltransferase family protein [Acetatifactor sp.]